MNAKIIAFPNPNKGVDRENGTVEFNAFEIRSLEEELERAAVNIMRNAVEKKVKSHPEANIECLVRFLLRSTHERMDSRRA